MTRAIETSIQGTVAAVLGGTLADEVTLKRGAATLGSFSGIVKRTTAEGGSLGGPNILAPVDDSIAAQALPGDTCTVDGVEYVIDAIGGDGQYVVELMLEGDLDG